MKLLRHQIRALEIAFPDGFIEEGKKIGQKTIMQGMVSVSNR